MKTNETQPLADISAINIVRRMGEFSSDAIIATDPEGRLVYANDKAAELFGRDNATLIGSPLSVLIPDRHRGAHQRHVDGFAHGKQSNRHLNPPELRGRRADGTEFPAAVSVSRISGDDGFVLYASIRDLTEQAEAAAALAASERRLKTIFDGAAAALWQEDFTNVGRWLDDIRTSGITDLEAYLWEHPAEIDHGASLIAVLSANPAGQKFESLIERTDGTRKISPTWLNDSVRSALVAQFLAVWDNTPSVQVDMVAGDDPDQQHNLILQWNAPETPCGLDLSMVVVSMLDITDKVKAEEHLETVEEMLRRAQKLEAIGQLAAGVAHEINTPIQYVSDNAGFLRDSFLGLQTVLDAGTKVVAAAENDTLSTDLLEAVRTAATVADYEFLVDEIPEAFEELLDGIQRVAKIVAALKKFSHPGTDEKLHEDLNRIVEDSLSVSASEWKHHAKVTTNLADDLPTVQCMANEISQVIINIVVNAAHAIAEQPTGTLGDVEITTQRADDHVSITISDSGPGIPRNIQDRVFEPFFTTKDVGKGTGQGLALAHKIVVDQHHGRLLLDSEPGQGTTFRIEIPLVALDPTSLT